MNEELVTTAALRRDRDRLRHLSAYLLQARESERSHIAKELHDQIGQSLTACKLRLQALRAQKEHNTNSHLVQVTNILESSLQRVSDLSRKLRPPQLDLLGLGVTLKWYLSQEINQDGLAVQFTDESGGIRLDWQIETMCFRVVQEALANVLRHARAHQVNVSLHLDKRHLHVRIEDDGKGFDPARAGKATGLGLLGMEEGVALTGGTLKIDSVLRRGTVVHAAFPLTLATPRVRQNKRVEQ